MRIPKDLLALYAGLPSKELFYVKARWLVSPVSAIEEMVPREGRVYDIGCGVGLLSNMMAMRSDKRDVTGFDLSEEKIAVAGKTVLARKNIRFKRADVLSLTMDAPDVIVACDLFHHIPLAEQELFLKRMHSALDRNGLLLIQDIDTRPFLKYLFAFSADLIQCKAKELHYRSSAEFGIVLEKAGFKVEIKKMDRGYPIAAVLFRCRKVN